MPILNVLKSRTKVMDASASTVFSGAGEEEELTCSKCPDLEPLVLGSDHMAPTLSSKIKC